MDNISAPKLDIKLPVARTATAPATPEATPVAAAPAAPAPVADKTTVKAAEIGLDSPSRAANLLEGVPEVDFTGIETTPKAKPAEAPKPAAPPEEDSFFTKAMGLFGNALSISARAAISPLSLAADLSWLEKVKAWFTSDGNATLNELAQSGKLGALDKNLLSLRGVIDKLMKAGADPALVEALNAQTAQPETINQLDGKMTCQAAVFQKQLAEQNPGAYVKLVYELFTKGKGSLPDGTKVSISPENMKWLKEQNLSLKDMIDAVVQVALVEAVQAPGKYDVATDTVSTDVTVFGHTVYTSEEKGEGLDFRKVLAFFQAQGAAIFDPRTQASASDQDKAAALKAAFDAAKAAGQDGLSVPVHSAQGNEEKYHMMSISQIDAQGNVTVFDPRTGKESTYAQEEFLKLVGWDISASDNVGGGRPKPSGGGGTGGV